MTDQPSDVMTGSPALSSGTPGAGGNHQRWYVAAEAAALAVVLAAGAYLRLAALDYAQFRADDFALWSIARQVTLQPRLLTQGMDSSLGLANGPFQAYLLLPATVVGADPLPAYFVVALLNVLGVALFWAFVRGYWGARLALLAALLFAVNPWAVVFSRRLLGNDLVAPFSVLLVWSLCDLFRYGRRRDSVLPLLWLAIVIQLYVVALVHLLLAALGLLLGWRRLRPAPFLGGLLLFVALTAPYLAGTVLPNLASLSRLVAQPEAQPEVDSTSIRYLFHLVSTEGYQAFANQAGAVVDATSGLPHAVTLLAEAFLAIGLVAGAARATRVWRRGNLPQAMPYVLPMVAMLLPALLLVRHSSQIYMLYLVTVLPMPYLFVALGIGTLWVAPWKTALPRVTAVAHLARLLSATAVVLVVVTQLLLAQVFFSVIHEYWPKSDYGLPLRYTHEVGDTVRKLVGEQRFGRALVAGAGERDAVLYGMLRPDLPDLRYFDSSEAFVRPDPGAGQVLYVVSSTEDRVGQAFAARFGSAEVASLAVPGAGLRYSFYGASSAAVADLPSDWPDLAPSRRQSARLGDYLEFLGYDLPSEVPAGGRLRVALHWKVLARPTEEINLFAHLIGGLGSPWGQWDGVGYPQEQWQPGDLLVGWHEVSVPVGAPPVEYQVEAGGYFRSSGQRLPVQTEGRADDRLRLGSVRVTRPVTPPRVQAETPVGAGFGDGIRLLGYDLAPRAASPGDGLKLVLYWQSLAPTSADYTVFVHLVGEDSRPVAQADSPPAFGAFPTSAWQPGDVVRDPHDLTLPADLRPGRYWVLVGLYVPPSGPRLAPTQQPASLLGRLGPWLERRTPYRAGPRVDGDRVVLAAVDVGDRR